MIRSLLLKTFGFILLSPSPLGLIINDPASANDHIAGPILAKVERVIDGDTVKVRAQIWLEQELEVNVRVAGIDAPELFRPKCDEEKQRARASKHFVEEFFADENAYLHNIEPDKYGGRVVAQLTNSAGKDLGKALVKAAHAVAGPKGVWCQN